MLRRTRHILVFVIGDHSERTCRRLWRRIPQAFRQCARYSDFSKAYETAFPINFIIYKVATTKKIYAVDVIITKAALHHLPDFWKQIALCNMNSMLKRGGILYLFDVVFHFHPSEYQEKIRPWIQEFESKAGQGFTQEVEIHIRDEYSTFHWILEGMLHKAGFKVEQMRTHDGFLTEYHCIKTGDRER